jgi:hypothetical protein
MSFFNFKTDAFKKLETEKGQCDDEKQKCCTLKSKYQESLNTSNDIQYQGYFKAEGETGVKYYQKYIDNETNLNVYLPGKIVQVESSTERQDFPGISNRVNEFKLDTALAKADNKYIIKDEDIYRHKDDIIQDLKNEIIASRKHIEALKSLSKSTAGGSKYNRTRKNISRKSAYKNLRKSKYYRK